MQLSDRVFCSIDPVRVLGGWYSSISGLLHPFNEIASLKSGDLFFLRRSFVPHITRLNQLLSILFLHDGFERPCDARSYQNRGCLSLWTSVAIDCSIFWNQSSPTAIAEGRTWSFLGLLSYKCAHFRIGKFFKIFWLRLIFSLSN